MQTELQNVWSSWFAKIGRAAGRTGIPGAPAIWKRSPKCGSQTESASRLKTQVAGAGKK